MKKLLMAGAAFVALTTSASAQLFGIGGLGTLVFDPTNAANTAATAGRILDEIGVTGEVRDQVMNVVTQAVNIYNEAINIEGRLSGVVGAQSWAQALASTENILAFHAQEFPGYISGQTDPSGLPYGSTFLANNTVGGTLAPFQQGDFVGGEIAAGTQSLSSMQASAANNLDMIEQHITAIPEIVNQLADADSVQKVTSITSRLSGEMNYAARQNSQAANFLHAAKLQMGGTGVWQMRQMQQEYLNETAGILAACTAAGNTGIDDGSSICAAAGGSGGGGSVLTAANPGGP